MKNKINPLELSNNLGQLHKEIAEGLKNGNFTTKEISSIETELDKLELQAYKTKLGFEIHLFSKSGEQLTYRDFVLKMLGNLPNEVPVNFLPALTEYILENWVTLNGKMAA